MKPPPPRLAGLASLLRALRGFSGGEAALPASMTSFTAADGQRIPLRLLGEGPPVVLVHGLACSHRHWLPVARRLAARHRVIAWDARGHGLNRPARGEVTLARLAADLAELLDHLELPRAALVGHSMGALTVMRYLHDRGTARVAAVALVDQSPRIVTDADWRLGLFGGCSASMLSGLIAGARQDLAATVLHEVEEAAPAWLRARLGEGAWVGRTLRRWLGRIDARPMIELGESLAEADFRATLARLDAPLLVVLGGRSPHYADVPLPQWYRDTVRHAQVSVYERAGHSPHFSEPVRFAKELAGFLADHA